jgi:hypothetical protein
MRLPYPSQRTNVLFSPWSLQGSGASGTRISHAWKSIGVEITFQLEEGAMSLCGLVTSEVKAAISRHHIQGFARRLGASKRGGVVLRG